MIDIWMLFTMTVPFLEVALHTCTEVMKRPSVPHSSPDGRVHQVKPADQLGLKILKAHPIPIWVGVVGRLVLPIISIMFTAIFWTVGLTVSYWPNSKQDSKLSDCLTIEHD